MSKDEELLDYINIHSLFRSQLMDEYKIILDIIGDDSEKLKNIRETYGLLERETFNFFESIDKYWKEDFHEIILTQILNPHTKEIGNIKYLHIFTKLIQTINNAFNYNFENDVVVENQVGDKEHGYIDILISNDNDAVIIESKINGAVDQDNQLARYYRYVKDILKKDILAIVYIRPIDDEYKMPPLEDYTKEYKNYVEFIRKLLIPISIVDSKNRIDLCHSFLDACCDNKLLDKASVYIKQYSELLKIMGGNKMIMNVEKELFKKLFGESENLMKTIDVGSIWDNRWLILGSIIQDDLVKEMKFVPDGDRYCYKKINDKLSLTFIYDPDSKKIGDIYIFGFSYESINQKTKKELMDLLNNIGFESVFSDKAEDIDGWLIVRKFDLSMNKTFNQISNDVLQMYKVLKKEEQKIIKLFE